MLTAVAALGMQLAFAQNSAVTNAAVHLKNGTLDKAKTEIDKAVVHEKTANSAKAWSVRGDVYATMIDNPIFGKLSDNPIKEAVESYNKAISLDKPGGQFATQATEKKQALYGNAINAGAKAFEAKSFDEAITAFSLAQELAPTDTTGYLYAAFSAEGKQDFATAATHYNKLLQANIPGNKPMIAYQRLYHFAKEAKDNAKAQEILSQAIAAYPNNKEFMLEDLNNAVASGKGPEAIAKLEKAIEADPNNVNLYNVLGSLHDQAGKRDLARQSYERALKVEANNFDANFNLGVIHYNSAAELSRKFNAMSSAAQKSSGAKMTADIKKHFNNALPYFEAAHRANPQDASTIETLAKVYIQVGRTKDAEAMNKKADALNK